MKTTSVKAREGKPSLASLASSLPRIALRLIALGVLDAFAVFLIYLFVYDGLWLLAVLVTVTTLVINVINLWERFYPLRWMTPALAIIMLFVLYPILFTVYTAFTNYSDGHLLTKVQSIRRIGQDTYLPEGGVVYSWTAYRSPEGEYALWLVDAEGNGFVAYPEQPLQPGVPGEGDVGAADENGIPANIGEFGRLTLPQIIPILDSELAPLRLVPLLPT